MKNLLGRLWNNTFHLEGKFIRTAWQLFIPGKVTVEFFKGKQDRYPHPIRMFAIVMFLFLFVLNTFVKQRDSGGPEPIFTETNEDSKDWENPDSSALEEVPIVVEKEDTAVNPLGISKYDRMKHNAVVHDFREDYNQMPAAWKTPETRNTVDSLLKLYILRYKLNNGADLDSMENFGWDTISFGMFKSMRFATLDIVRYDPEEIIKRYKIESWVDKQIVRQTIKSYKTPDAFLHAATGSMTWAILALVALMSGVLGLLYIRQKRYYVEHFIFLLHFHTGAMLLLLVALLGKLAGIWGAGMVGFAAFLPLPGTYFALLRFYGQSGLKTFVKWVLYCFFYFVSFLLLFVAGMIAVFAFY